ncbi:MAG: hypothetical protein LBD67_04955 [Candidatus Accumulibacter sp.]|jgi:hypothetical protein|nr:hypothetical protein [Accumulibacter sp.]
MTLTSISSPAASSPLSAINPDPRQDRGAARPEESERQDTRQTRQSTLERQNAPQTQPVRQTPGAGTENRVAEDRDRETRPTVNAEGQLVGRKVNITA